ncbi:MAG TPA: hypothetical protein VGR62_01435 [Candidatus Binatia bacterium]|nr:hypothetical protein [Candidatus Binatia bacterium]
MLRVERHVVRIVGRARRSVVLLTIVLGACAAPRVADRPPSTAAFPVPRAQVEFDTLVPLLDDTGAPSPMDPRIYVALGGPYAPLDLQITRAASAEESSTLQNAWLGVSGAKLGVDTMRLANGFHCGPVCVTRRKTIALESLKHLREIVDTFWRMPNLTILAQWGQPKSFRANNVYIAGPSVREAEPSPEMGFVPSGRWIDYADLDAAMAAQGLDKARVLSLLDRLWETHGRALVRSGPDAIRAILGGIGDNETGVLFQRPDAPPPRVGESFEGMQYVVVEQLDQGTFYFETS